jgi:hypothetical protein
MVIRALWLQQFLSVENLVTLKPVKGKVRDVFLIPHVQTKSILILTQMFLE